MGMNFSPMYQPVSTKTIKADGDLNVNPYDLLATDVKCDTVEASEFVGGVGNFTSLTRANIEGFNVVGTTVNTGIPLGSITGIYEYSPSQAFPNPGNEFVLVPEFSVDFEVNSSTETFDILNVEGVANTSIAMTNYAGAFPATIYIYINGVKTTLFSTMATGTSTATRDLEQGAKVKISAVNNWSGSTNVGTKFTFTYSGSAYLK